VQDISNSSRGEGQQPLIGTSERPIDDENGTNENIKNFRLKCSNKLHNNYSREAEKSSRKVETG